VGGWQRGLEMEEAVVGVGGGDARGVYYFTS